MVAVEVPLTLELPGWIVKVAPVLVVEKISPIGKRGSYEHFGIEPQFENIIKNGPFIPMTAGQRKPENQWTGDERKAANLDQRLKSLIIIPSKSSLAKSKDSSRIRYSKDSAVQRQMTKLNVTNVARKAYQRFEAKYNKVKAKLALLSSSASASKALMVKKKVLSLKPMNGMKKKCHQMTFTLVSEAEGFILPNHDTGRILPAESQRNTIDPSVAFSDSSATDYDSADESSVCSTPFPSLKMLEGGEPIFGPKTIKSILKLKSTLKAEALKCVIINEPSSAPAKGNKSSSASKVHSVPAGKLKSVKIEDDPSLAIVMKELNSLKLQVSKNQSSCEKTDHRTCDHAEYMSTMNMSQHLKSLGRASSRPNIPRLSKRFFPPCIHCGGIDYLSNECLYYPICKLCGSYDHDTNGHNRIISLEREINPRNPQHAFKRCEACGSSNHTITDHYDIEWFKRGEALHAKKAEALKSTKAESSNANRSKTPTKSGCSRHMTSVKVHLTKYVNKTKDLKWCLEMTLHAQLKVMALSNVMFDEKRGTIFNSNKEIVMIAPRVRDVYVLDMTSSAQESFFFAKASEILNWILA
ncbi:hypothetical protein Tco_1156185 [Tanacetum coccineum]